MDFYRLRVASQGGLVPIWTKISGEDRQMLTQIVQRWGILSVELKRAF
tara:strand:+ start:93 stop:236 length:144 start_codon:yes stop_codon:yes gene_type:complete